MPAVGTQIASARASSLSKATYSISRFSQKPNFCIEKSQAYVLYFGVKFEELGVLFICRTEFKYTRQCKSSIT
jgi:aromatic ring hydroxylase